MDFVKVGFAKGAITPKKEIQMAGYPCERVSEGIHDDLYSRVVVFKKNDNDIFALVQLDLIMIDYNFNNALAKKLNEDLSIKETNLVISCIHTHSGPAGIVDKKEKINKRFKEFDFEFDKELVEYTINKIVSCVKKALKDMGPFKISYNKKAVNNLCTNRNDPSLFYDNELQTLLISKDDGKRAVIYNFACHPTILHEDNKYISADYPGETAKFLEEKEDIDIAMFYNGACGDVSTRFTKKGSSFAEVERIGKKLGSEVVSLMNCNKFNEVQDIKIINKEIQLNIKELISHEKMQEIVKDTKLQIKNAQKNKLGDTIIKPLMLKLGGAKVNSMLLESLNGISSISLKVKILSVNDIYVVYIPGELFSSLGNDIKKAFSDKKIFVVCYSTGYIGYIPDKSAYDQGGFEVMMTPLAKGEGERLDEFIIDSIRELI